MAVESETTPLLSGANGAQQPPPSPQQQKQSRWVVWRILFCGFLTSLSLSFTQVPMLYAFRLMTCDEYYKTRPLPPSAHDRCNVNEIEAETARQVALVGTTTTIVGVLNLLFTGWMIKKTGPKLAMIQQTFWPVIRLCFQTAGVAVGAQTGITIIQVTQIICLLGGPAGYMLALNTFISEVVTPADRTAVFGQLQGVIMFGTALGYLLGGIMGDIFGIRAPWEVALCSMAVATIYSALFLPYVSPPKDEQSGKERKKKESGVARFLGPTKMLVPQRWRLRDGRAVKHFGVSLLFAAIFTGVLATGYIPTLVQMYSTIRFGFGTKENGFLMSYYCIIRGGFLTFAFPKIISCGRLWFASSSHSTPSTIVPSSSSAPRPSDQQTALLPPTDEVQNAAIEHAEDVEAAVAMGIDAEEEPVVAMPKPPHPSPEEDDKHSHFDLFFLKWSLLVDGILTGLSTFCSQGWHIFIVASILPLASGSAPAAKSVIIEMCPASEKADALSAISLVEMVAMMSTLSLFGLIFSALAEVGRPNLVFVCNAGVAFLAVALAFLCRFPPEGSKRVASENDASEGDSLERVEEHLEEDGK